MQSYNLGLFLLLALPFLILNRVGFWMLFKKAGVSPWKSLVPFLNWWHWVQIVGRPTYYFFLLFVPIINPIIWFTLSIDLLKSFGRFKFSEQVMGTLFQFAYTVYIGVKKEVVYLGAAETEDFKKKHKIEKSFGRDWADAIWFAVMVASLVRMIYVEPYQIPSSSMERSLRVGDYLFVSKLHNGFRVPSTPVSIPFVHRDLLGVQSYSSSLQLPYMRFPGWVDLKSGDPSVFNYPADEEQFPTDKKLNFIKRCVAGPGDSLRVKNGRIYINQTLIPKIPLEQTSYIVGNSKYPISTKVLDNMDIYDYMPFQLIEMYDPYYQSWLNSIDSSSRIRLIPKENMMVLHTTLEIVEELEAKGVVDMYLRITDKPDNLYPHYDETPFKYFTVDNCGPYYCPRRGDVLDMTIKHNLVMYYDLIRKYEDNDEASSDGTRLMVDGKEVKEYTFKYNYYWMMGDNRHNSSDSRFWGFVPETHILGKPLLVLFSIQYKGELQNDLNRNNKFVKIRWNRLFKGIN